MMDKSQSDKWKPLKLKHVRKFALERFKQRKEQHQETDSSNVPTHQTTQNTSFTDTQENENQHSINTATNNNKTYLHNTPKSIFERQQHQNRLLNHPYTDVLLDRVQLKKMVNDISNETKPLTQPAVPLKPKLQPKYHVHREVLTHDVVIKKTGYGARDKSIPSGLRQCWEHWSFLSLFAGIVPIVQWLPKYKFKKYIIGDIISGVTVAIMHIPHGMAYGLLAGVSAGNGLYMAIFPVLVYLVLGSSRHISIGTFSVISMMTLKVVQTHVSEEAADAKDAITPLEVVTALAFTVGIVHLIMGLFRLGTLARLLSDPLVNGFTTAAAVHVVTSQLKDVLGVTVPRYKGAFKIIYTLFDLCTSVPQTNLVTFLFCICVIIFMAISNELVKPYLGKKCRLPLPAELIAVIGGTLISDLLQVHDNYNLTLVGDIPTGLPAPFLPRFELIPLVAADSIAIAVVSYSIVMSMGLTFAKKHNYELRPNQELFALGIGNLVGGCFACIPIACSLSRSVIQDQTGGATQLASLISAGLVTMTLLWAGPFFSTLPRCVLAGVIIVALKPLFMQAGQLKKYSKQGKLELLTWICTFTCVVVIDIDIGLLVGIGVSLLALYIKGWKPYSALLGVIPDAEAVYVDISHHRNAAEIPETKIFRYTGSLNFATNMFFRRALYDVLGVDSKEIMRPSYKPIQQNGVDGANGLQNSFQYLVLDFSMLGHIDVAGCHTISDIMNEMDRFGVRLFIASPTDRVYDTLVHSMALGEGPFEIFPTLHDAVMLASALRTA